MIEVRARRVCRLETQAGGREKGVSAEVFQRGPVLLGSRAVG